jgi:hypothetical protein
VVSCVFRTELRPAQVVKTIQWTFEQVKTSVSDALWPF